MMRSIFFGLLLYPLFLSALILVLTSPFRNLFQLFRSTIKSIDLFFVLKERTTAIEDDDYEKTA